MDTPVEGHKNYKETDHGKMLTESLPMRTLRPPFLLLLLPLSSPLRKEQQHPMPVDCSQPPVYWCCPVSMLVSLAELLFVVLSLVPTSHCVY